MKEIQNQSVLQRLIKCVFKHIDDWVILFELLYSWGFWEVWRRFYVKWLYKTCWCELMWLDTHFPPLWRHTFILSKQTASTGSKTVLKGSTDWKHWIKTCFSLTVFTFLTLNYLAPIHLLKFKKVVWQYKLPPLSSI